VADPEPGPVQNWKSYAPGESTLPPGKVWGLRNVSLVPFCAKLRAVGWSSEGCNVLRVPPVPAKRSDVWVVTGAPSTTDWRNGMVIAADRGPTRFIHEPPTREFTSLAS
jgi:hypothetical protein